MAQYEVATKALLDAGEQFESALSQLNNLTMRLEATLADWPEALPDLREALAKEIDGVHKLSADTRNVSRTLYEIVDIYTDAERTAFHPQASTGSGDMHAAPAINTATPPAIRDNPALLLFGEIVMPEWLQMAVLRYEQSQHNTEPDGRE